MTEINHAGREHAILSASGAKRWMACTPSARLEEKFPSTDTAYTLEGTRAHEIAEQQLRMFLDGKKKKVKYEGDDARIFDEVLPYVERIKELYAECRKRSESTVMFLETQLDFSEYVPDGFGTGDVILLEDETLHIIDLKFGKGVRVDAENNPQLHLYGLGAINAFDDLYDFKTVAMHIEQPRLSHSSEEVLAKDELLKWGNDLKPIAQKAYKGEGEFHPGEHCKFCKASGCCKALADYSLEIIDKDVLDPQLVNTVELGSILEKIPTVEHWIKAIKEHSINQVLAGKYIPGWKLVEGRSLRKYTNDIDVINALHNAGYEDAVIFEKKLYGITAMEKNLGKKKFGEVLGRLIYKPEGAPTLAPESDKRPEFKPQQSLIDGIEVPERL